MIGRSGLNAPHRNQRDFWRSSGFHLLERRNGRLGVTDDLLRAYLARPELSPIAESCPAEQALHAALLAEPRRPITPVTLVRISDKDAAENYAVFDRVRQHLLAHETIEAAYLAWFRRGVSGVPSLIIDQIAHMILRNILDGCDDPFRLRAAECLFRTQKLTVRDDTVLLADEEVVEMHARSGGLGSLGRLLVEADAPMRQIDLDILTDATAASYWQRCDRFDMVLDLGFTRPGLDALARVLERWIGHFTGLRTTIQPKQRIDDRRWAWHIGLDELASRTLDALYHGGASDDAGSRMIALFSMTIADQTLIADSVRGRPIYLGIAGRDRQSLRLKPQNLLVNLPLKPSA